MTGRSTTAAPRFSSAVVLLVQCAIVVLCVAVTTVAATQVQQRQIRAATEERVLDVARSLAGLAQVRDTVDQPGAAAELQPLADLVEEAAGVDYVVITDDDGVRLTHPDPARRGLSVSTDPTAVLAGAEFLGTESGTLGPTLRAKVPVHRDGVVVGTASVGVLESRIAADQEAWLGQLVPWVLGALVVGCLAAAVVSHLVGRRVRRLRAQVAELDAQRRLTRALREQTHEFHTRLHAVHGLIESGAPEEAMAYIADLVPVGRGEDLGARIADPRARTVLGGFAAVLADGGGQLAIDPLAAVARGALSEDDLDVLANLLRNAVEAVGPGGRVEVFVHGDDDGVELAVSDDGPGIDPELVTRVLQHGFSTKRHAAQEPRGVGLALVHRIVTARGGELEIGRSVAGGARVAVRMPAVTGTGSLPGLRSRA